ncbi:hypothetical protein GQ602_005769 [Ophiocordyceps camponoti-floridani]|uniref:Uncharacterized protein n=1 Tax=Ophiocordyceps camponoti-floridani TaxID=2030778 RepID=A0A8H4VC67_9HYPO|nr:hypothetical protein GQ602_005769 [Ophiocordyceps camponoti-floridani]
MTQPPTEQEILTNYLIQPSPLITMTTLPQFQHLFPPSMRNSPMIRTLFRDLQEQRGLTVDAVQRSIVTETMQGQLLLNQIFRQERNAVVLDPDIELDIEQALGDDGAVKDTVARELGTVVLSIDNAIKLMTAQVEMMIKEELKLLERAKEAAGGLSDLRYGRFDNGELGGQVIQGVKVFCDTCHYQRLGRRSSQ